MAYYKQDWENRPSTNTPISAERLLHIEQGIYEAFEREGGETLPVGSEIDFIGSSEDIPQGWEEVTNPNKYSTTEVKTNNVWIDGKPIYRKVFNFGALPNNTSKTLNHNISNLGFITLQYGVSKSSQGERIQFAPYYYFGSVSMFVNDTEISVSVTNDKSRFTETYIIIEYTKTTD